MHHIFLHHMWKILDIVSPSAKVTEDLMELTVITDCYYVHYCQQNQNKNNFGV